MSLFPLPTHKHQETKYMLEAEHAPKGFILHVWKTNVAKKFGLQTPVNVCVCVSVCERLRNRQCVRVSTFISAGRKKL